MNQSAMKEISEQDDLAGPGKRLKKARESMQLSCTDVARELSLNTDIIKKIERNSYTGIAPIYACGYLKQYARLVKLPESDIIDSYQRLGFLPPGIISDVIKRTQAEINSSDRSVRIMTYVVVTGLLVLFGLWWYSNNPLSDSVDEPSINTEKIIEKNKLVIPPEDTGTSEPEPGKSEIDVKVAIADKDPAINEKNALPLVTIQLDFQNECWLEISDATGKQLAYKLKSAGSTSTVQGIPPFSVFLGDAEGVNIAIDGQLNDYSQFINTQGSARFTIDRPVDNDEDG